MLLMYDNTLFYLMKEFTTLKKNNSRLEEKLLKYCSAFNHSKTPQQTTPLLIINIKDKIAGEVKSGEMHLSYYSVLHKIYSKL